MPYYHVYQEEDGKIRAHKVTREELLSKAETVISITDENAKSEGFEFLFGLSGKRAHELKHEIRERITNNEFLIESILFELGDSFPRIEKSLEDERKERAVVKAAFPDWIPKRVLDEYYDIILKFKKFYEISREDFEKMITSLNADKATFYLPPIEVEHDHDVFSYEVEFVAKLFKAKDMEKEEGLQFLKIYPQGNHQ